MEQRLQQLYTELKDYVKDVNEDELPNKGLLSGNPGTSLFFYYYSLHSGDEEALEIAEELLVRRLNHIGYMMRNPYLCNGLAGVAWLIRFFEEQEIVEISGIMQELLDAMDESIVQGFELGLRVGNFDYLHGACGILNYLIRTPEAGKYAVQFVTALDKYKHIPAEGCIAWKSNITGPDGMESVFNLGFAHGMPSVVVMLALLIEKKLLEDETVARELIGGSIRFFLAERKTDRIASYSNYSSYDADFIDSRLAWCYGDLGVCLALLTAGKVLQEPEWIAAGEAMALKTISRKSTATTGFLDAGLCHGSAGAALIYRRMFQLTGNSSFHEAAGFWAEETLKIGNYEDGIAGFKMWTKDAMLCEHNILDGAAGTGLALLTTFSGVPGNWENCLLPG